MDRERILTMAWEELYAAARQSPVGMPLRPLDHERLALAWPYWHALPSGVVMGPSMGRSMIVQMEGRYRVLVPSGPVEESVLRAYLLCRQTQRSGYGVT